MSQHDSIDIDRTSPPFDQLTSIQRLSEERSGHASEYVRHRLYVGRDKRTRAQVLIKLTSKPGTIYQHNLTNEIASLSTINRELPDSRHFPLLIDHGRLRDGRVYLVSTLFDESPLATTIGTERMPGRMVGHLRTTMAVAAALTELHGAGIVHVDLNPMNILYRAEKGQPVIRIVDFESSYEAARHSGGPFYNPPTTPGYSAPEVSSQAPDVRADVFSLGAVLYTMVATYKWTWEGDVSACVNADSEIDPELKSILRTAVAPNREQRYPSVRALHDAVGAYLERIWPGRSW
jgi:serine/threonine protein kinase